VISTRRKIVVIADQLIRSRGYNAFSYSDIANRLNLKNAAIHYHYPSKAALGKAVIIESREKFLEQTKLWKDASHKEQVRLFLDMYQNNRKNGGICFMGAFGASYATLPEEMRTELKVAHTEIINWLSKTLEAGKDEKAITFDTSAAEMADLITASMMSSLILERISSRDMTSEIARNLIKGLEEK
jgi:TetR/AcrR family transcriptional regulator, transcriptional repressor for nem operon